MGLHSGRIILGSIGARDHYEYRAVGDIVITATRLEGLNKYLGTRILTSEEVLSQVNGFLARELGRFLLVGKSKPIVVYELMCRCEEANAEQIALCQSFSKALNAFRTKSWDEAVNLFYYSLNVHGQDGPSSYYLNLCQEKRADPSEEMWDGLIRLDKK
jgi:adenylate cyclase